MRIDIYTTIKDWDISEDEEDEEPERDIISLEVNDYIRKNNPQLYKKAGSFILSLNLHQNLKDTISIYFCDTLLGTFHGDKTKDFVDIAHSYDINNGYLTYIYLHIPKIV